MNKQKKFMDVIAQHPFNVSPDYSIDFQLPRALTGILLYRLDSENESHCNSDEFLSLITPRFQRENTKWPLDKKIKFVENILAGYKTTILFYSTEEGGGHLRNCFLLDGLQRMTAIKDFLSGLFPVFDQFYAEDVKQNVSFKQSRINAQFYHFKDDIAACEHYIAMNEGFTHCSDDIDIAYRFLAEARTA